ncbi:DUF3885 domain-containing protein [Salipaludibacillus sp. LMS25]|uniref:DUF3885 domain-containing protein n=1 Tax=Salipaludibacillus sp. LMS25 TaxID=2924031 RepID=UPI0020D0493D|nr:DUF3885 domain-containing protein [Salipaludibacillus sp. LMS25]UTR15502.1 DUF3885 domain-containing protein [Salipaludibacillus sp. LMS25]
MELRDYLNTFFPGLCLQPSLFIQWDVGIHFELGEGIYQFKDGNRLNIDRFERVYYQALSLFNDLFSEEDDIYLVTNVYFYKRDRKKIKPTKVYDRFLKNKHLKLKLRQKASPFVFGEEDAEEYDTTQFYLKCKKQDLNYLLLIKAACNEDFPLKPKLGRKNGSYYPDVFFINISKNLIFFIYDDRGCEVIANKKEAIMPLYKEYNGWIPEYDREEIERNLQLT